MDDLNHLRHESRMGRALARPQGVRHMDVPNQNRGLKVSGFVRKGKTTFLPFHPEKLNGCSFSDIP